MHQVIAAAFALALASPTAIAGTVVQTIAAREGLGDLTPFDLRGTPFDPALGTLLSVRGVLAGTVTPATFVLPGPSPTTIQRTSYFLFTPNAADPGPNAFHGTLADDITTPTVTPGGATYNGPPTAVSLVFNFGQMADFYAANQPGILAEFGFRSSLPGYPPGYFQGAADLTTFDGTFTLTYTYGDGLPVAEPGTAALLLTALLTLPSIARTRQP